MQRITNASKRSRAMNYRCCCAIVRSEKTHTLACNKFRLLLYLSIHWCLSVCPFIPCSLCIHICIYIYKRLHLCVSLSRSVSLSRCLSPSISISLFSLYLAFLSLSLSVAVYLSIDLSIYLSIHLSICWAGAGRAEQHLNRSKCSVV